MPEIQLISRSANISVKANYIQHKRIEFNILGYNVKVCKAYGIENRNNRGYNINPCIEINTNNRATIFTNINALSTIAELIKQSTKILALENDGLEITENPPISNNVQFTNQLPQKVKQLHSSKEPTTYFTRNKQRNDNIEKIEYNPSKVTYLNQRTSPDDIELCLCISRDELQRGWVIPVGYGEYTSNNEYWNKEYLRFGEGYHYIEVYNDVVERTQNGIYVDSNGILNIKHGYFHYSRHPLKALVYRVDYVIYVKNNKTFNIDKVKVDMIDY